MPNKPRLSGEKRTLAAAMAMRGEPMQSIADAFGVSRTAIYSACKPKEIPFHHRVIEGRCCHCGASVVGSACIACEVRRYP